MSRFDYQPNQGPVTGKGAYQTFVPGPPLNHWVQCFWQLNVPQGDYSYRSLPDNCVDLIVNLNCPTEAFLVTPFSSAQVFNMIGPVAYFGIRFCLLGHRGLVSVPLGEWPASDAGADAAALLQDAVLSPLCEQIVGPRSFSARCHAVAGWLLGAVHRPDVDSRVERYIRYCRHNIASDIDLSDSQCAEFGLSARQLRRLTHLYLGCSPRAFARVLRFQSVLGHLGRKGSHAVWTAGYYDQPHFIREFKRMAGVTPTEFSKMSVLYKR